jgi:NADH:ubiquinone oxidoreductase subunit K
MSGKGRSIFPDMVIMLQHALNLGAYMFCISIFGLITSRNMVRALMCLELLFNAVNINSATVEQTITPWSRMIARCKLASS